MTVDPSPAGWFQATFEEAVRLHQQGFTREAEEIYRRLLRESPDHAGALHLLGLARHQQGDYQAAIELIGRALALNPTKAVYLNNYGAALIQAERHTEAAEPLQRAVAMRPDYADAHSNLGMVWERLGDLAAAEASLREALRLAPYHRDATLHLAAVLEAQGRIREATQLLDEAARARPQAEFHVNLGNLLRSLRRTGEAAEHYRTAAELKPDGAAAHFDLGCIYEEQHRDEEAREAFRRAAALEPKAAFWPLRAATVVPAVFASAAEIDAYRRELLAALGQWSAAPPAADWEDLLLAGAIPNFALAYHGRNNRPLKERFAAFYEPYFRGQPPAQGSGLSDRRRVGIVVTEPHEGVFLRAMRGILENLDPDPFELVVLCSAGIAEAVRQGIRRDDLRVVGFPRSLRGAAEAIRAAACDLLYYWEICSDPLNYFLPFARLAPRQCTSHGSQVTTGMAAVDYFLTSDDFEPPEAAEHYTERLWRARSFLIHQRRLGPVAPATAGTFGLPDDARLYVCYQNPLKLHPDLDPLLAGILCRDRKAYIVLSAGRYEYAARWLRRRFAATIPAGAERIAFLPWQEHADYCRLLQRADVILDPLHFGSASSAYDIFSFNQPLVTMPGRFAVGRIAAAFCRRLGMEELVAASPDEYVEKAVWVANDREYRACLRQRIAAASDRLFDDGEVVREHARFFADVLTRE